MFIGLVLAAVVALVCLAATGLHSLRSSQIHYGKGASKEDTASEPAQAGKYDIVEIGGVRCRRRTRIRSYLFIGTDSRGKVGEYVEEDGPGQCDVLMLIVIDQNEDTYTILPINRDTVTAVKSLEDDGTLIATSDVQIALAHANGDGREISCENTVDAVSHLLYDQTINGYIALNMDSVSVINHVLDGVTVTIQDDFSEEDPELVKGETVKLTDEQAMHYVRGRMSVGDGTNEGRMKRHSQFMEAAMPLIGEKTSEDEGFLLDMYDALGDYMVTSLSGKDFSKLSKALLYNEELESPEIQGVTTVDYLGFKEFTPDQKSLDEIVIDLFYERLD